MRYRLRLLLQEFDLQPGTTIIGRSPDCNLTIEDPLVSRQHARIVIDSDGAWVEDLNSRNGVRVNGVIVREPTVLRDGDRVRVGTQDLVFCRVGLVQPPPHAKTTGVLRVCAKCRLPYPRESLSCPHCEATEQTDEGTLTGEEEHGVSWTVQLLAETLDRALALGRIADAQRIVPQATARLEEYLSSGGPIDTRALGTVAASVASMTAATCEPTWILWVLDLYRRLGAVPSLAVVDRIAQAVAKCSAVVAGPLGVMLGHLRASIATASDDEIEAFARLERIWRMIQLEQPSPSERAVAAGQ
ncbi:MAG TPA: FHA domain-containing protein [Polyangiaceae bacterium]|nr:FHA domain-containing protein [Polyangiaceae bacterium]